MFTVQEVVFVACMAGVFTTSESERVLALATADGVGLRDYTAGESSIAREFWISTRRSAVGDGARTEVPLNGDERVMLNAFLDAQRDTLEWKCSGLTSKQLKEAASRPSPLTLLGLLRHMTEVEYFWLEYILLDDAGHLGLYSGQQNPVDGDRAWTDLDSHPADEVLQTWKEACATSRRNAASLPDLDSPAAHLWDNEPVNLRWITVHMIREYARHTGHADLLREQIDGATGE